MINVNAILEEAARARIHEPEPGFVAANAEERKHNRARISRCLAQVIFPPLAYIEAQMGKQHRLRFLRHQLNDGTWTGFTLEFPLSAGAYRFEVASDDESPARIIVKDGTPSRIAHGTEFAVEGFAFAEYERLLEAFLRRAVGLDVESWRPARVPILGANPPPWQSAAAA
jgi:hypothetical protein